MVRLADLPDMTLDVYRGRKPTMQQQQQQPLPHTRLNPDQVTRALLPQTLWQSLSVILGSRFSYSFFRYHKYIWIQTMILLSPLDTHTVGSNPSYFCSSNTNTLAATTTITVIILNIGTDRSEQTVQTLIRLLLMEQSDQGLLCCYSVCIF